MISYRHDTGAWLNAAGDHAIGSASEPPRLVRDDEMTPCMALEDFVDLNLGHYNKDNYQLVVNMEKVEFLDSTGLGVLVGGLKRVRAHDGSLDLVCTQERILKIFRITGLTKVFGIHS